MSEVEPRLREHIAVGESSDEEFVDAVFASCCGGHRTPRHESGR